MPPSVPSPEDRPKVRVVCAVLVADGRLLACQRPPGKALAGCWEFPGGKVETGESDESALARELEEELGLVVRIGPRLPAVHHVYPQVAVDLIPFLCRPTDGHPPPLRREHAALRWVGPNELDHLPWAEADLPILEHLRRSWPAPES